MAMTAQSLAYYREWRQRNKASVRAANRKHYETYGTSRRNPEIRKASARKYYYKSRGNIEAAQREQEKIDQLRLIYPRKKSGSPIQFGDEERLLRRKATIRKTRYRHILGLPDLLKEPETCEICGRGGKMCVDHCHATNVFRGWICDDCNVALGKVKDDVGILTAMIDYVQKRSTKTA